MCACSRGPFIALSIPEMRAIVGDPSRDGERRDSGSICLTTGRDDLPYEIFHLSMILIPDDLHAQLVHFQILGVAPEIENQTHP